MKNIYITGDRSMDPFTSVQIVGVILGKIHLEAQGGSGIRFTTGDSKTGIERAVRYLIPERLLDVVTYDVDADGKTQFDEVHLVMAPSVDEVVFIHSDPLSSRIGKSVNQHFGQEKISMPLQEL